MSQENKRIKMNAQDRQCCIPLTEGSWARAATELRVLFHSEIFPPLNVTDFKQNVIYSETTEFARRRTCLIIHFCKLMIVPEMSNRVT